VTVDPLYIFVFAGLFSPGPNVILLLASGAQFGARATWAHILGVAAGVGIIGALVGFGIGAILLAKPEIALLLKLIAVLWIIYMAWGLWVKSGVLNKAASDKPFTFVQAVLFQWVNPKIWAVAIAASAGYAIGLPPEKEALRLALIFTGINLFVCTFWTYTGQAIARFLKTVAAWSIFHKIMSILLALSALMIFK
jgi:threonine/homoserine/homoserine lactone efflux protein